MRLGTAAQSFLREIGDPLTFVIANPRYVLEELPRTPALSADLLHAAQESAAGAAQIEALIRVLGAHLVKNEVERSG